MHDTWRLMVNTPPAWAEGRIDPQSREAHKWLDAAYARVVNAREALARGDWETCLDEAAAAEDDLRSTATVLEGPPLGFVPNDRDIAERRLEENGTRL